MVISRLMPRGSTARSAAAAAGIVLLVGACGGGGSSAEQAAELSAVAADSGDAAAETENEADPSVNELADVEVIDVATGDLVNLKSFAPADKPIVLWFWAPH